MARVTVNGELIETVMRRASEGFLAPAAFRRPYVWGQDDVERFWASLLRGWPTGQFLIWRPPEGTDLDGASRGRIGPIQPHYARRFSILLDGQNRLATFAWSMAPFDAPGPSDMTAAERATWRSGKALVGDPDARAIRFVPAAEATSGNRVPVRALFENSLLWSLVLRTPGRVVSQAHLDWFDQATRALMEARCHVTELVNLPPEEALEAFRHLARAGVAMSEEEFEAAMAWALPSSRRGPR